MDCGKQRFLIGRPSIAGFDIFEKPSIAGFDIFEKPTIAGFDIFGKTINRWF